MIMRNIALIISGLLLSAMSWGQGELSISAGGGFNTILSHPVMEELEEEDVWESNALKTPGFMISSRFLYFFGSGHVGIGSGADFFMYRSKVTLNGTITTPSYDDINGQAFDLMQSYDEWVEKQRIFTFEFPLGVYYKASISDKTNFVGGVGGKMVVPAFSRYQITEGTYAVSGYYPQTDATIKDLPHHGFVNTQPVASGGLNTRLAFSVYGELGFNFALSDRASLHTGLYCNYGITRIVDDKRVTPGLWDDFMVDNKSILSSKLVEKSNLLAVGLKIGVSIPTNVEGNTISASGSEKISKTIE